METRFKQDMETLEGLGTKAQIRNTGLFYLASIPSDVAKALRAVDKTARAAVEQRFLELVGHLK